MKVDIILNEKTIKELKSIFSDNYGTSTFTFLTNEVLIIVDNSFNRFSSSEFDFYSVEDGTFVKTYTSTFEEQIINLNVEEGFFCEMCVDENDDVIYFNKLPIPKKKSIDLKPSYRLENILQNYADSLGSQLIAKELLSSKVNTDYYFNSFYNENFIDEYIINYRAKENNLLIFNLSGQQFGNILLIKDTFFESFLLTHFYKDVYKIILSYLQMNKSCHDLLPLLPHWALE